MPVDSPVEQRRRRVADFASYCVEAGRGSAAPFVRRPLATALMLVDAMRLPVLHATLSTSPEAAMVRRGMTRARRTRTPVDALAGVLVLPSSLDVYVQAPARRTVRRKVRAAAKVPVTWRPIDDDAERVLLLGLAEARERSHPDAQYRHEVPDLADLVDARLWLAAEGPDGPLMLVVVPVEGEWATLRYFRTLTDGEDASVARYLMTEVLVGQLIGRGVRYLADTESPFTLPNGLRHFQRMVGFELYRLRVRRAAPSALEEAVTSPYSMA